MSQHEKINIRRRTLYSPHPEIRAFNLRRIRFGSMLGLLLALFLSHPAVAVPTRDTTVLPPKLQDLPREAPGEPLHWLTDLQEALSLASRSNRAVIVYFYSPECSWCRRLDQDTLQMPETRKALADFVLVRVNVLEDEKTPARYRVRGTPVLLFLSPEGRESFRLEGFVDSLTLKDAVDEILGPKADTPSQSFSEKLELLKANKLPESEWPDLLLALGEQSQREPILQALARMNAPTRAKLVELLEHRLLAVRLGALEILEGWTGDDFSFDPWKEKPQANAEALQKWKAWLTNADSNNAAPALYQTLSPEETEAYLRDYLSEDRDRAERAKRMLQRGGASSLQGLQSYLTNNTDLPAGTLMKVREMRYSLILPPFQTIEPATLAHRLVYGNLDVRQRTLRDIAGLRSAALPVLQDFLTEPEPLLRETAVDGVVIAGRSKAVPILQDHLARETDQNVIYQVLKQLGRLPSKKGLTILAGYLDNPNEDFAIIALESMAKLGSSAATPYLEKALDDPRWRVRVTAIKSVQKLRLKDLASKITRLTEEKDAFVRSAAVEALAGLGKKEAIAPLASLFMKDDSLKGTIIGAFHAAQVPITTEMINALEGKEPSVLLTLLDHIESADNASAPLLRKLAEHSNADVSCAALRMIAGSSAGSPAIQNVAGEQLRKGDRQRVATILNAARIVEEDVKRFAPEILKANFKGTNAAPAMQSREVDDVFAAFENKAPAKPAGGDVDDIFQAFGAPADKAAESYWQTFLSAGKENLAKTNDNELCLSAALFLVRMGDLSGANVILDHLQTLTSEQRASLADNISRVRQKDAIPLIGKLLADPTPEIRAQTVEALFAEGANEDCVQIVFSELGRAGTRLRPEEVYGWQFRQLLTKPTWRKSLVPHLSNLLTNSNERLVTFALILARDTWSEDTEKLVQPFLRAASPWHRRAALYALGRNNLESFAKELSWVTDDPSEFVRAVIPAVYGATEGRSYWSDMLDGERTDAEESFYSGTKGATPKLNDAARASLKKLSQDRSDKVRFEALYALMAQREPFDVSDLISIVEKLPRNSALLERLVSYVQDNYEKLGPSFAALMPFLDFESEDSERYASLGLGDKLDAMYEHFGIKQDETNAAPVLLASKARPRLLATFLNPSNQIAQAVAPENFSLVFFSKPGCQECEGVKKLFPYLRETFPKLNILEYDITRTSSMLVNEALSRRFGVPDSLRLVAPAIFTGGGYLIKDNIKPDRLGQMLLRGAPMPLTNWLVLPDKDLSVAHTTIVERYETTGLGVIMAAGLLDGINPCAFATVIFLLSWLRVTRRPPGVIAQVGVTYIIGVFLAYFLIGLGLVQLTAFIVQLRWASRAFTYGMAAFALILTALSIRDGIYCLRGRMGEMTLQLPDFLKNRIHTVLRQSVRNPHFVLLAFFAGITVSFLELACTGQVYLPTITYMIQQGNHSAIKGLVLYNGAFILPLTFIFVLTYFGLTSETLLGVLKKRAALVKFGTAVLFLAFALLLFFTSGGLPGGSLVSR